MPTIAQTLAAIGRKAPAGEDFTQYLELPLRKIFEPALGAADEKSTAEAVRICRGRFPENSTTSVRLFPGVRETLAKLREAGMVLAIASSRGKRPLLALTGLPGITDDFARIAREEDAARPRPAPDMAELVGARTGIPLASAMFIGDTVVGKAAGMAACGIACGNYGRARLLDAGADHVIDTFSELPGLLREQEAS